MNNVEKNNEMIDELRNFVITAAKEASFHIKNNKGMLHESYIYSMTSAARIVLEYDKDNSEE